jgi:hypothetical protein
VLHRWAEVYRSDGQKGNAGESYRTTRSCPITIAQAHEEYRHNFPGLSVTQNQIRAGLLELLTEIEVQERE